MDFEASPGGGAEFVDRDYLEGLPARQKKSSHNHGKIACTVPALADDETLTFAKIWIFEDLLQNHTILAENH